jgi:hypothetical protein
MTHSEDRQIITHPHLDVNEEQTKLADFFKFHIYNAGCPTFHSGNKITDIRYINL